MVTGRRLFSWKEIYTGTSYSLTLSAHQQEKEHHEQVHRRQDLLMPHTHLH